MRIFRIITALLSLSIVNLIVESCCPELQYEEYSLSSFSISPMDRNGIMRAIGGTQYRGEKEPYPFRTDFGVHFLFSCTCKRNITSMAKDIPVKSLFLQPAFATTPCPKHIYYPKDSIVSIQVFSDKDFDQKHLAGTNVADFFKICKSYGPNYVPILFPFEEYLKYPAPILRDEKVIDFFCLITATHVESGEYNFRFVIKLSDGRILEQSIKGVLD